MKINLIQNGTNNSYNLYFQFYQLSSSRALGFGTFIIISASNLNDLQKYGWKIINAAFESD